MPTIQEIAAEMGVDLSTVKPEFVTRISGLVTDADKQFQSATQLKEASEANLRQVQQEQDEINRYIEQYGASEQTNAALRANYAAMEAQLKSLKEQGIPVEIPAAPAAPTTKQPTTPAFNPDQFADRMGSVLSQSIDASNKHLALYGKPMPDSLETLAAEAKQARKTVGQHAAEKYDFSGEEKRKSEAAAKAHDEAVAAAAVKKYQEDHPNVAGNPFQARGESSSFPQILKPREAKDQRAFANLSPREKIAQSVARSREAIAANQA